MINTRSSSIQDNPPNADSITHQLMAIASKLNTVDTLVAEVAALKAQSGHTQQAETNHQKRNEGKSGWLEEEEDVDSPWGPKTTSRRPHTKMEFPEFEGGDRRGWILKA